MMSRSGYAATAWSLGYTALGVSWALGAAALAYHLRRRGACRQCGREDAPARPAPVAVAR